MKTKRINFMLGLLLSCSVSTHAENFSTALFFVIRVITTVYTDFSKMGNWH